jgi:hypothetical protein
MSIICSVRQTYNPILLAYNPPYVARLELKEAHDPSLVRLTPHLLQEAIDQVLQVCIPWLQHLQSGRLHLIVVVLTPRCLEHLHLVHPLRASKRRAEEDQTGGR